MFELLLVLAGGVIGVSGGLLTALVTNALETKKARRDDLLAAYVEWTRAIYHAIYEAQHMWVYDAVEELKKKDPEDKRLNDILSSPSGRTRQEHARDYLTAIDALHAAEARLLLLERRSKFREEVSELSILESPKAGTLKLAAILKYTEDQRIAVRALLEEIAGPRSGF
jgi:hypothetical protein